MKKYILSLFAAVAAMCSFTACSEDDLGTTNGADAKGAVTIYQYGVELPLNSDNDTQLRFVVNNKTEKVYYFAETEEAKAARNMSDDAYADYVVANGKEAAVVASAQDGSKYADVTLTGLEGMNVISAVAVSGSTKSLSAVKFKGLAWETVCDGTYTVNSKCASKVGVSSVKTKLQKCTNEEGLYRFTDVFGAGYNVKFNVVKGSEGEDKYGKFVSISVAAQTTPTTYGSYGAIGFRDVATWMGDDSYLANNQFYDYNEVYIWMQYFVSAGSLGYGYDSFIPAE